MYRTEFWTLWEMARVGCFKRTALKHVYYLGWKRSPAHFGCMRQVLRPGALGRPRGIGWRGRWEGGSGWGIHVNPWLIHVNVWQKPLQYCKVISLQLKKKKEKRIHLAMHGRPVGTLVQDDSTCLGATEPLLHNYWALALEISNYWAHVCNYWSPHTLGPMLHKRRHHNEKPTHCN